MADFSAVPGVVVDYSPQASGLYLGSPSLACRWRTIAFGDTAALPIPANRQKVRCARRPEMPGFGIV